MICKTFTAPGLLLLALVPTLAAQSAVVQEADIEYANTGGRLAMDIVRPASGTGPFPAVLLIHGGGFRSGNRQSMLPLAKLLAERGFVAAAVSYRLSPRDQFPAPLEDLRAALRFLRANARRFLVDAERIGAYGESAGGNLALLLGFTRPEEARLRCIVNFYGRTDLTDAYEKSANAADILPPYLGGDLAHQRKAHIAASPAYWVTPQAPPVLTVHGTEDRNVPYEQAVLLTDRLKSAGVETEFETIEKGGHGFKGAELERARQRTYGFLARHLGEAVKQRRLLIADHGPAGEVLLIDWPGGKVHWRVPNARGHDVQALPGGHVLFTAGAWRSVFEMDQHQRVVWQYGAAEGLQHPLAAQRLTNGNTLIGDARLGKVIEVDRERRIVWQYESPDLANMRMRSVRRTPQNTTLIAIEAAGRIIEVDRDGKIVWSWDAPGGADRRPYQAHRLPNGNTLIPMTAPGEVVEVDAGGRTVRSIGGTASNIRLSWASGTQPLTDGGVLISDYLGRRLVEVNARGEVVHELRTGAWTVASVSLVE